MSELSEFEIGIEVYAVDRTDSKVEIHYSEIKEIVYKKDSNGSIEIYYRLYFCDEDIHEQYCFEDMNDAISCVRYFTNVITELKEKNQIFK